MLSFQCKNFHLNNCFNVYFCLSFPCLPQFVPKLVLIPEGISQNVTNKGCLIRTLGAPPKGQPQSSWDQKILLLKYVKFIWFTYNKNSLHTVNHMGIDLRRSTKQGHFTISSIVLGEARLSYLYQFQNHTQQSVALHGEAKLHLCSVTNRMKPRSGDFHTDLKPKIWFGNWVFHN